jgi:hypothetical protein
MKSKANFERRQRSIEARLDPRWQPETETVPGSSSREVMKGGPATPLSLDSGATPARRITPASRGLDGFKASAASFSLESRPRETLPPCRPRRLDEV